MLAVHDLELRVGARLLMEDVSFRVAAGDKIYFGRKDILPEYKKDVGTNHVKIESVRMYVNGNAGWDFADFHVTPTDGKSKPFTFAILFLWSKINGEWVCLGDYFDYGSFRRGKLDPARDRRRERRHERRTRVPADDLPQRQAAEQAEQERPMPPQRRAHAALPPTISSCPDLFRASTSGRKRKR